MMTDDVLATTIGAVRVYIAVSNLIVFLMLLWVLRKENGITGALTGVFFGAFVVNFWSVALLFNWFATRTYSLQFGLVAVCVYALTLTGLFAVLLLKRTVK